MTPEELEDAKAAAAAAAAAEPSPRGDRVQGQPRHDHRHRHDHRNRHQHRGRDDRRHGPRDHGGGQRHHGQRHHGHGQPHRGGQPDPNRIPDGNRLQPPDQGRMVDGNRQGQGDRHDHRGGEQGRRHDRGRRDFRDRNRRNFNRNHGQGRPHQGRGGGQQQEKSSGQYRMSRGKMDIIRDLEKRFERLTAIDPAQRFKLETDSAEMTTRVVDLLAPIGRGQRAMIVAPPKTGKTILLQKIAHAISQNHPEVRVICFLVDERPEEVTDFRRSVPAEVIASCNDQAVEDHIAAAEETFFQARQSVLSGQDVVVLMDSLTRLARAFNNWTESSGKTLSGGLDSAAMIRPRKFFGAARNVDRGGSLTIVASALVETGSRMDEIIFQEFKGTGNTEIVLTRKLSDQRLFPAIDLNQTGTRREERLLPPDELRKIKVLRRALSPLSPFEAMSLLMEKLKKTESNEEFLKGITI